MEDSKQEAPDQSTGDNKGETERRPSLAERLMNPQSPTPARPDRENSGTNPQTQEAAVKAAAEEHQPPARERVVSPANSRQPALAASASVSNKAVDDALKEARRFIRIRYFIFLASVAVLFATVAIATFVMGVSLLDNAVWEQQAASGAVAGTSLLLLILIQYRPAGSFASAALEISQLEVLRVHLDRSYALWDEFLEGRDSSRQVSANEVALAVSSMTAATRELVATQAELVDARRGSRRAVAMPSSSALPAPTIPPPRRY